jgi:hypothetical protein
VTGNAPTKLAGDYGTKLVCPKYYPAYLPYPKEEEKLNSCMLANFNTAGYKFLYGRQYTTRRKHRIYEKVHQIHHPSLENDKFINRRFPESLEYKF